MDQADADLMERAYARRIELLAQPGVKWVTMWLSGDGVILTAEEESGDRLGEWIARRVDPADGGAGNGEYDRE
jgi:hypothetical protein